MANDKSDEKANDKPNDKVAEKNAEKANDKGAYMNPDPKSAPKQRPMRAKLRPKKPSGFYLTKTPVEIEVDVRDARGNLSTGRKRIEIGQRLPESVPDETLATLEDRGDIEPEFIEDNG